MSKKREAFIIDDESIHFVTNEFSGQAVPTTVMSKCIPVECTSNPITDILTSTTIDHHKPLSNFKVGIDRMKRSTAVQCDKCTNLSKDKRKSKFVESSDREENNQNCSKSESEKEITLLERIIRTHPIWYLQHIGRSAAIHLLLPMKGGAFIVRSSSKPNAMALSIRSPPGLTSDIDHYLIESAGPDRNVRVESSPYYFKSLPLLIEHYCLNGEELQTNLVLPVAITRCCTSMQLQSLALMGQDFWTSNIAQEGNNSHSSQKYSNLESSNYSSKRRSSFTKHYVSTAANDNSVSKRVTEKRISALTSAFMDKGLTAAKTCSSNMTSPQSSSEVDNDLSAHTISGRRSLLRHIFRSESSSNALSGYDVSENNSKRNAKTKPEMVNLAQCHTFTPLEERRITSSQSAFVLSSTSSLSTQHDADSLQSYSIERSADCPFLKRNLFTRPLHQHAIPSLHTFKPGHSAKDIVSQEEMQNLSNSNLHFTVNPKPTVKPKPLTLRHERNDLTNGYLPRFTADCTEHNASADSNVSLRCALMPPSTCLDENILRQCLEELKRKREEAIAAVSEANSRSHQQQQHSRRHCHKEISDINFRNVNIVLRTRSSENFRTDQRRLSVPDLADMTHDNSLVNGFTGVAATVKALTSKLGRNPRTGELQFAPKSSLNHEKLEKQSEQEHLKHDNHDSAEHIFTRKFHSERHSKERVFAHTSINTDSLSSISTQTCAWSPSAVKRVPHISDSYRKKQSFFAYNTSSPSSSSTTNERFISAANVFAKEQTAVWSAVNSELKNRQKLPSIIKRFPSQPSSSEDALHLRQQNSDDQNTCENLASEYVHISESIDMSTKTDSIVKMGSSNQDQNGKDDDDISIAGTIFNEPWDSNVWENLLDLAHYGDEKPSTLTRHHDANQTILGEAIVEEGDDEVICSLEISYDGEEGRSFQKLQASVDDGRSKDDYGVVIRRFDNHHLNNNAESDGRRNGIISISAHLKNEDSLDKQQQVESSYKSVTSGNEDPEPSNSMINISNAGETSDGTATMDSYKSANTHSLPRIFPRYSKLDDSWLESLDDIPTSIRALSPIISPPRLKNSLSADPGTKIQEYVERLSQEENTVFGATLRRFIECTFEAEECDPQVVIRNVRQFLNGLKNYLVKHGEGELHDLIEKERARLNANEFLNIDAILEAVLHKIVLSISVLLFGLDYTGFFTELKLKGFYISEKNVIEVEKFRPSETTSLSFDGTRIFKNGWLQALSENLTYVRTLSPEQLGFGVRCKFTPPTTQKMETIKICLRKMQHHYSPLKKLENLLRVIFLAIGRKQFCDNSNTDIENYDPISIESSKIKVLPPADELVRWLVYLLARTSTVGCEVEAWYMWELLPKQLLTTGDSSYYLITLFSAIDVLKNTESIRKLGQVDDYSVTEDGSYCSSLGSVSPVFSSSSDAFVKVAVPDELDGSIRYHTFPGVPQMTAGKLCRVIAHQFGITNPEDHGLYLLVDGYETCLLTNECPDLIRHQLRQAHKAHLFAYKRHEAKIAWPKFAVSSLS
ncbi:Protein sprint [Dirofilaria immitis]|nr:Protein sprint [Dirofilaria immitis]